MKYIYKYTNKIQSMSDDCYDDFIDCVGKKFATITKGYVHDLDHLLPKIASVLKQLLETNTYSEEFVKKTGLVHVVYNIPIFKIIEATQAIQECFLKNCLTNYSRDELESKFSDFNKTLFKMLSDMLNEYENVYFSCLTEMGLEKEMLSKFIRQVAKERLDKLY